MLAFLHLAECHCAWTIAKLNFDGGKAVLTLILLNIYITQLV